ncbi:MAG: NAD(P)(+) transhydrogenase (Re/Si-specific) subunit beta [Planctomycetota bacterium]
MTGPLVVLIAVAVVLAALAGIRLLHSPRTAVAGNGLLAACVAAGLVAALARADRAALAVPLAAVGLGALVGLIAALRVPMIAMPQMVATLNGLGGAASALVGTAALTMTADGEIGRLVAAAALAIGAGTFSGSVVAAGKLQGLMGQRSVRVPHYPIVAGLLVTAAVALAATTVFTGWVVLVLAVVSLAGGLLFAIRIGGADMPVAISLLNALSGLAAAVAGFVVADLLLVAVGAVVGAAGLILTQIMCRAMNRSLLQVLSGIGQPATATVPANEATPDAPAATPPPADHGDEEASIRRLLDAARSVIIIPGYGMALAQAQAAVKALADELQRRGKAVAFAIHPVAGRMPGHMNVLLAEVDVPYAKLLDLDAAGAKLPATDLAIVVGANDVINPAARTAEGTPIYGMPVLPAADAGGLIICNRDRQCGYAGVANPLYDRPDVRLLLGDARDTVARLLELLNATTP